MSKALITGGAGFIGAHLARALVDRGHRVDLLDSLVRGRSDEDIAALEATGSARLVHADLLDPASLDRLDRDYDWVVHLAAVVGVVNVLEGPERTLRDNVRMLDHVLSWARGLPGVRRFLFPSTSEVYAGTLKTFGVEVPTPESVPLTIPDVADPRSSYALSKIYGEALCHHAGVPFTIVRPHNVYGARMGLSHVIPELLERAHAAPDGGVLEVYSLDHRRTFCHVDDGVEIIARALEAPQCAGETINLGAAGPEVTIRELAEMVADTVGKQLEIRGLPATPGSPTRRCPDMSRTTRLTGYAASVDLPTGLARTYEWYRERVFAAGAPAAR